MSNFCFRGNSPLSQYISENKTKNYLTPKLKKEILDNVDLYIKEIRRFKYKNEMLNGYELYLVLADIIKGCDLDTLKHTNKLMKKDLGRGVRYLLSII